jgi:hypothetical protein
MEFLLNTDGNTDRPLSTFIYQPASHTLFTAGAMLALTNIAASNTSAL